MNKETQLILKKNLQKDIFEVFKDVEILSR